MLRHALDLERGVTQTHVGQDAELLKLALNVGLLRPASKVSILLGMRDTRFSSKRDLRVEVMLVSNDLSLVIFKQLRNPSKVFDTLCLTGTDFKILWTSVEFGLPVIRLAIF